MEPSDSINGMGKALFPMDASSVAADYLAFLAERVPNNLAEQLHQDAEPDISMPSQTIDVAYLVRPLSSGRFPSDNLLHATGLLGYVLIGHGITLGEHPVNIDPYKVIYAASLYLHCFVSGGGAPCASGYPNGLHVLVIVCLTLDLQTRLQVCRFLASLVPMLPCGSTDEPAALSILLLALSLIVGSILGDLSVLTKRAMHSEFLGDSEEARAMREYAFGEIAVFKSLLSEMYGAAGKVRQGADRLIQTITEAAEMEGGGKGDSHQN